LAHEDRSKMPSIDRRMEKASKPGLTSDVFLGTTIKIKGHPGLNLSVKRRTWRVK